MWLAPFYIMAIGNACSQLLPAHWPALTPLSIWPWACLELLLMIAWLLYEIWFSANRDTPGSELQLDAAIDMTIALGLCVYAANRWGAGVSIGWWFYLPSVGAIVDAYQSALLGINNAMQKPGVSPKLGT
ncbi:MAG TPA: hypothetical protein VMU27_01220 [Candidatus Paceibacterota bacterium]|nr:hypothetical protein [Candidatus Paceibacterota bacterium]